MPRSGSRRSAATTVSALSAGPVRRSMFGGLSLASVNAVCCVAWSACAAPVASVVPRAGHPPQPLDSTERGTWVADVPSSKGAGEVLAQTSMRPSIDAFVDRGGPVPGIASIALLAFSRGRPGVSRTVCAEDQFRPAGDTRRESRKPACGAHVGLDFRSAPPTRADEPSWDQVQPVAPRGYVNARGLGDPSGLR